MVENRTQGDNRTQFWVLVVSHTDVRLTLFDPTKSTINVCISHNPAFSLLHLLGSWLNIRLLPNHPAGTSNESDIGEDFTSFTMDFYGESLDNKDTWIWVNWKNSNIGWLYQKLYRIIFKSIVKLVKSSQCPNCVMFLQRANRLHQCNHHKYRNYTQITIRRYIVSVWALNNRLYVVLMNMSYLQSHIRSLYLFL